MIAQDTYTTQVLVQYISYFSLDLTVPTFYLINNTIYCVVSNIYVNMQCIKTEKEKKGKSLKTRS